MKLKILLKIVEKIFGVTIDDDRPRADMYLPVRLLAMSLILLARWEITYHLHPERFSIWTNAGMSCRTCKEKLCHHKKQLQGFWKKNKELIRRF